MGGYIPTIPLAVPKEKAVDLIKKTRTVFAAFTDGDNGLIAALPLDYNADGGWKTDSTMQKPWEDLISEYGATI